MNTNPTSAWSLEVRCQHPTCNATVALSLGHLSYKEKDAAKRVGASVVYVCPTCRAENLINPSIIPPALRAELDRPATAKAPDAKAK